MKTRLTQALAAGLAVLLVVGCSSPVLRQDIPVSTNPLGARIYADGQLMGTTPGTVSLERNRSHILTLLKENHRQQDVVIERHYQRDKAYLKAIQSGIHSGLFFNNPAMGVQSGMMSLSAQEATGEAYILAPPAVAVTLMPLAGTGGQEPAAAAVPAGGRGDAGPSPRTDDGDLVREVLKIGAGAALMTAKPLEKKVETSSSSRSYVRPDGTLVREKSSTSVGVSVNPAGLVDVLDVLFQ